MMAEGSSLRILGLDAFFNVWSVVSGLQFVSLAGVWFGVGASRDLCCGVDAIRRSPVLL